MSKIGFLLLLSVILTSCAGYSIKPQWGANEKSGYRIYQPRPYLSAKVTASPQGAVTYEASIIYLPDYSKPYKVSTWNFLGKADFTFKFEDGWKLTEISDKSDNTAATKELASAALGFLGVGANAAALKADDGVKAMKPTIFRLDFDEETGELIAISPVTVTE